MTLVHFVALDITLGQRYINTVLSSGLTLSRMMAADGGLAPNATAGPATRLSSSLVVGVKQLIQHLLTSEEG